MMSQTIPIRKIIRKRQVISLVSQFKARALMTLYQTSHQLEQYSADKISKILLRVLQVLRVTLHQFHNQVMNVLTLYPLTDLQACLFKLE